MGMNPHDIDWDNLGFDPIETKSMFRATCKKGEVWDLGELTPFGNLELSPAACVLNYGQGAFEGMKAYHTRKGRVVLFRPDMNGKRLSMSAKRLCMPEMDVTFFLKAVMKTVKDNREYIPPYGKGSLYIRPIMWGTSPTLGVKPADEYTFLIYVSPVGPYFKGDVKPLNLCVTTDYHRAAPHGIGNVKAIGNYSASLYPMTLAKNDGFDEVIYLNAGAEGLVEEMGSANLFTIKNNVLKTPQLAGSILPGITRDSVLTIAKEKLGIDIVEGNLTLRELLDADEVFCTGTAVVVTPVGTITHNEKKHTLGDGTMGHFTHELRNTLLQIQSHVAEDSFGWLYPVPE